MLLCLSSMYEHNFAFVDIHLRLQVRKLQRQPLASRWDRFVANLLPEYPTSAAGFLPKGNFDDDSDDEDAVGGVPVF